MRRKAEELANRLREREKSIEDARNVISLPPIVQGGILVIPKGMLAAQTDGTSVGQGPYEGCDQCHDDAE